MFFLFFFLAWIFIHTSLCCKTKIWGIWGNQHQPEARLDWAASAANTLPFLRWFLSVSAKWKLPLLPFCSIARKTAAAVCQLCREIKGKWARVTFCLTGRKMPLLHDPQSPSTTAKGDLIGPSLASRSLLHHYWSAREEEEERRLDMLFIYLYKYPHTHIYVHEYIYRYIYICIYMYVWMLTVLFAGLEYKILKKKILHSSCFLFFLLTFKRLRIQLHLQKPVTNCSVFLSNFLVGRRYCGGNWRLT